MQLRTSIDSGGGDVVEVGLEAIRKWVLTGGELVVASFVVP
jgi:hypothetical protein